MLVQCPQCGAAYDFPDDRVTAKGLKAACGRCKLVMIVKPAGADGRAVVEVPPSPRQTKVKRPKRRAPVQQRPSKSERPKRSDSIVSSTRRSSAPEEDDEPSIVIDMGHFNDGKTPPPEPAPLTPEEEEARRQAESAAAFAPLSVAPVQLSNPRYAPPMPVVDDDGDVPVIRQAMFLKTFLVLIFLSAVGFVLFVAWKNDWGPIWEDPEGAVRTALNLQAPESAAPPAPIVEPQDTGALGVDDPKLLWLDARTVMISGTVNNRSSRIHHAIGLDVALMRGDLPLGARVVPCCATFSEDDARKIARDQKHAHFDPSQRTGQVSLKPGETAAFSAILRGLPADAKTGEPAPKVGIKYSDPERVKQP